MTDQRAGPARHSTDRKPMVAGLLAAPGVPYDKTLHRPVGIGDYLWLSWLATSMAAVGGALGAVLENSAAVRQAAYGYHPDERIESERREA